MQKSRIGISLSTSSSFYSKLRTTDKNQKQAIQQLKKAIQINPNNDEAYCNLGYEYFQDHNYEKAFQSYKKAIQINQQNDKAYWYLGYAYFETQQYSKAIQSYKKAIEINKNNADIYCNLGYVYAQIHHYHKAIQTYQKAIEINPNESYFYYNLGNIYYQMKKYNEALQQFNNALRLQPGHVIYILIKISVLYQINDNNSKSQAYNLFNQLPFQYDFDNQKQIDQLKKNYKITDGNVFFIKSKITQYNKLKQLRAQCVGNQFLDEICKVLFDGFKNFQQQQNDVNLTQNNLTQFLKQFQEIKQKIDKQQKQIIEQKQKIESLQDFTGLKIENQYNKKLKSIQNQQQRKYFQEFSYRMVLSISSYQHLSTGSIKPGDQPIKSQIATFLSYLQQGSSIARKIPIIQGVASMVGAIGKKYLKLEQQQIINIINNKFIGKKERDLYSQVYQILIQLIQNKNISKILQNQKQDPISWIQQIKYKYKQVKKQMNNRKGDVLSSISQFPDKKINQYQNLARQHCVQILTILITQKYQSQINPQTCLKSAFNIFIQQKIKENPVEWNQFNKQYEQKECPDCSVM